MRILQIGVAKSGNYWLYRILRSMLRAAELPTRSYIGDHPIQALAKTWDLSLREQSTIDVLDVEPSSYFYRISSVFRMPVEDVDGYLASTSQVWTHSPFCDRTADLLSRVDRTVYLVRDPRDVAVSQARFQFTPYMRRYYPHTFADPDAYLNERFDFLVDHWVQHVAGYLDRADEHGIHVVFYERLFYDFETEIRRLLDYLGIALPAYTIADLGAHLQIGSMKRDNPEHVRKGGYGEWVTALDASQKRKATLLAGPLLAELGYPRAVAGAPPVSLLPGPQDRSRRGRSTWLARRSSVLAFALKAWRRAQRGIG